MFDIFKGLYLPLRNKQEIIIFVAMMLVLLGLILLWENSFDRTFSYHKSYYKGKELQLFHKKDGFVDAHNQSEKEIEYLEKNKDVKYYISVDFFPSNKSWFRWPYDFTKYTGLVTYPEYEKDKILEDGKISKPTMEPMFLFSNGEIDFKSSKIWQEKAYNAIVYGNLILFIGVLIVSYFIIRHFVFLRKYIPCPNCNKSIKIITNWTCDYCHNKQGKERSIFYKCSFCKRKIETVFCEFCDKEVKL